VNTDELGFRRGSAVRREGDHRLEQDLRVDAAFGEAELPLPKLIENELIGWRLFRATPD
jgi:hypothetical protein